MCDGAEAETASWRASWLPSGFKFSGQGETQQGIQRLSYTDGLASFSVFVGGFDGSPLTGGRFTQRGAVIAYMTQIQWQQKPVTVAVVGEIPMITAQRVISRLQPVINNN